MTTTATTTSTYTTTDVEAVVRRVGTDLAMIADSSGCWTKAQTANYVHDIELLAKRGYLRSVDVTLINGGAEVTAVCFTVNTQTGSLTSSRPGGVLWPRIPAARLRIVLSYTAAYTAEAEQTLSTRLKIGWTTTYDDISHSALTRAGGRSYASNSYGIDRKDWTQ